jgi:kynurenine formamidase
MTDPNSTTTTAGRQPMSTDSLLDLLTSSRVFDLEHDRYIGAPIHTAHWPGFVYTLHRHHEAQSGGPRTSASGTVTMQEHSGTHIDALCHQAIDMEMFGGIRVTPNNQTARGFTDLGIETVEPIFRRGVLLDVARSKGVSRLDAGYIITADDLEQTAIKSGVEMRKGDCVLVRTGWGQTFGDGDEYLDAAGLGPDAARWLAAKRPFLCGADNVALDHPETIDPELGVLPCHSILIVHNGIYIVENLNLEGLGNSGCHEFAFVCLPLKMRGVTGSPVRPVALAPASSS